MRLLSDLELWSLAKMGVLRITLSDVETLDLRTIQHFFGFEKGKHVLEEREAKRRNAQNRMKH